MTTVYLLSGQELRFASEAWEKAVQGSHWIVVTTVAGQYQIAAANIAYVFVDNQ